uniref:Uncharacterized protein n=1 Tax=Mycena chlorophos TaxID=658473 RepID=A0ABQ0M5L5_MYCCL|nr:predicted protein [Mycena chlorophos]
MSASARRQGPGRRYFRKSLPLPPDLPSLPTHLWWEGQPAARRSCAALAVVGRDRVGVPAALIGSSQFTLDSLPTRPHQFISDILPEVDDGPTPIWVLLDVLRLHCAAFRVHSNCSGKRGHGA